ncbi:MAG TPA: FAD/NAD(P)-binding oxidoreductase [Chloroflexia bacterium]|nr:FAD/NAD(P)-binding oxidoreductase [Chloroflexia bacterium]
MTHYKYLIIGGGMTAHAAIRGIREIDPDDSIALISEESDPPYKRPPLSKKLWAGKRLETVWSKIDDLGVKMHLGRTVKAIDPGNKRVTDTEGTEYAFDKLLLATGGTPRQLPFGGDDIIYFRTLQDYLRLRALTERGERFAVIGGGFIGSEVAAALAMNGKKVVMVLPETGIGERLYPPDMVEFLNSYYREKGVELLTGERAVGLERCGDHLALKTQGGTEIVVDGVVAGIGIEPNVRLAGEAGLEVVSGNGGIPVDELLRAGHPDIFAAGDVALFCDPLLERIRRVEHEDNANTMGKAAGRNMAGANETYRHSPFFYSDLFDLGYEAVGELDPRLETVADWKEPYREGVVYYLRDGHVRGVLLWNVWGQVDAARKLIAEPGPFRAEDLKGRLPG